MKQNVEDSYPSTKAWTVHKFFQMGPLGLWKRGATVEQIQEWISKFWHSVSDEYVTQGVEFLTVKGWARSETRDVDGEPKTFIVLDTSLVGADGRVSAIFRADDDRDLSLTSLRRHVEEHPLSEGDSPDDEFKAARDLIRARSKRLLGRT